MKVSVDREGERERDPEERIKIMLFTQKGRSKYTLVVLIVI